MRKCHHDLLIALLRKKKKITSGFPVKKKTQEKRYSRGDMSSLLHTLTC